MGILGGTFDPPHLGHIALAENAVRELSLDKVLFIPARIPPHKSSISVTPESNRYEMLSLALGDNPSFDITDMEFKRSSKSYTYETALELKKLYPDHELFFIIGADNILEMESWYKPDELISMINFAAANRTGFKPSGKFKDKVIMFEMEPYDISSTEIRNMISSGDNAAKFLHPAVNDYIKKHRLYTNNE
jgi:nicotinate-nucleotide adenylyltransferase